MRHGKRRSRLGMMTAHRNAAFKNIVRSLLKYQRIRITLARAKEARRRLEKLITLSKTDTVASRRRAYSFFADRDLVTKLFKETAPLFKERASGYTRIIPLGFRRGDGATMCFIELTERKVVEKLPRKKKEKAKTEPKAEEVQKPKAKIEAEKEAKIEAPRIKTIPKAKPTLEEEKSREKAKSEEKKVADKRSFMRNLRGLFRKRGDR